MSAVYDQLGIGYAALRRPDPSIAAAIARAVGRGTVVNVGAGAGSYEPQGTVVAVEPSGVMIAHHWSDAVRGLDELARVSRRQVVLTWDQEVVARRFWLLADYLPEAAAREATLASLHAVCAHWPEAEVTAVAVPADCTDGFFAAYWRRPEAYLRPEVRAAISGLALLEPAVVDRAVARLQADLASGAWDRRHAHLRDRDAWDCGYRLVVRG